MVACYCIWPKGGQFLHGLANNQLLNKDSVSLNLERDSVECGTVSEQVAVIGLYLEDARSKRVRNVGT
jgi:hypothetical protein